MSFTISDSGLNAYGIIAGRFVPSATFVRNKDNDLWAEQGDTPEEGALIGEASISGEFYTGTFALAATLTARGTISGTYRPPMTYSGLLSAVGSISGEFLIQYLRKNLVAWSKIGDTRILLDESNEAGYQWLPGFAGGLVHGVLPFKDKVPVVYGASGIFLLVPVTQPYATFGLKRLSPIGVLGSGAMCGGAEQHYFISADKALYTVVSKVDMDRPMVVELGYSEFIKAISPAGQQVVMHYDKVNERVYISSVLGGYVLTPQGLGGGYANLTAADGQVFASPSGLTTPGMEICTDVIDMQYRGIKTIMEVMVGTAGTEAVEVAVDYRYDKSQAFATSAWKLCNKEGVVFPIVSAVEFRIRVRGATFEARQVDYLSVKFKYSDKRYSRGPFQAEAQGGEQ